jgi:hypothetical protein
MLVAIRGRTWMRHLKIMLLITIALRCLHLIFAIHIIFINSEPTRQYCYTASFVMSSVLSFFAAAIFAFYGYALSPNFGKLQTNSNTNPTLAKLSRVAFTAFSSYFMAFLLSLVHYLPISVKTPILLGIHNVLNLVVWVIQAYAFLLLLGVKEVN